MNEDKATRYHRLKRRTRLAGVVAGGGVLVAFWLTGASAWLAEMAERVVEGWGVPASSRDAAVVVVYVTVLCVAADLLALPLAVYRGYVLERRYELSEQSFGRWLADQAKASALGLGLSVAAASVAYALLRWSPSWWWAPTALAFSLGSVTLVFIAPLVLFPLFFRLKPLGRATLEQRLIALARRAGAPVLGAYEWQLGARTRAANAALVGLGRTRRILLSDTLLAGYSEEEIEVILAHELAHHVHGDLWRALGIDALIIAGALLAGHVALHAAVGHHGLEAVADVAGMPVLLLAAAGWSLLALPLVNGLSRTHERRADAFALDLTRNPEAFIAAMRRLGAEHLADEEPSPLVRWLFHSHPPLPERIGAAREWMHQHPRV